MIIKKHLVPERKHDTKCPYPMEAKYITVHNTANDASAENEVMYLVRNNNEISYHFAVDDKEVIQAVPVNRNAWHCGDGANGTGNRQSIGVEICYSKSGGERYKKAEALAVRFIAKLLKDYGWGIDRVKKHEDWSGKNCPHRILDEKRWNSFKKAIEKELKKEEKTVNELTPGLQKAKDKLVGYGIMAADYELKSSDQVMMLSMMAALVKKIESGELKQK